MPRFQPKTIHTTAADGAPIVRVEMTNAPSVFATVDLEDWQSLVDAGFPNRWFLNHVGGGYRYVRFATDRYAGNLETVARTILGPGRGRVTSYRDGDRLNLRRTNLYTAGGYAPGARPAEGDLA